MEIWTHWLSLSSQIALGFLGAVVSLLNEWAGKHKVLLLLSFAVLVLTSTIATHQEWVDAAREKATAETKLSDSLSKLNERTEESTRMTALNTQLQQTLLGSNETIRTLSQQNFDQLTGGPSYPVLTPLPTLSEPNTFRFFVSVVGENTIWDVSYRVTAGPPPYDPTQEELAKLLAGQGWETLGTLNPGQGRPLNYLIRPSLDSVSVWTVSVLARNGSTVHFVEMRFNREGNYWENQFTIRKGSTVLRTQPWRRLGG